jgi:hypothetical protein
MVAHLAVRWVQLTVVQLVEHSADRWDHWKVDRRALHWVASKAGLMVGLMAHWTAGSMVDHLVDQKVDHLADQKADLWAEMSVESLAVLTVG